MKEEEMQSLKFEGRSGSFRLILELAPSLESLNVRVEHLSKTEKYQQHINTDFVAKRLKLIAKPVQIFNYISENIDSVIVESAKIKFIYIMKKANKKECEIVIDLEKGDETELKKDKEEEELEDESIESLDLKIMILTNELAQKTADLKVWQERMQQFEIKFLQTANNLDKKEKVKKQNITDLQELVQQFKERNQEYERKIQGLREQLSAEKDRLSSKMVAHPRKFEESNAKISHHPANQHSRYYSLKNTGRNSAKIARKGEYGFYNFVNEVEILPNQTAKLSIKITKTEGNNIFVGFCTKAGLGNYENYEHPESIYYICNGEFWKGGQWIDYFQASDVGSLIEVEVCSNSRLVCFRRNGRPLKDCLVPTRMKGKPMHFSIILGDKDDQVEVWV